MQKRYLTCFKKSYSSHNEQKMKFSIKDFFSKCDHIRRDLVTFTEKVLNKKLNFLCSGRTSTTLNNGPNFAAMIMYLPKTFDNIKHIKK